MPMEYLCWPIEGFLGTIRPPCRHRWTKAAPGRDDASMLLTTLALSLFLGISIAASNRVLHIEEESMADDAPWVEYEAGAGPGENRHIVLIAGDEEYRSEEALPMLARILSRRHGFRCTVLFSQDAEGRIDPDARGNIPGLGELETADLMVLFTRFRELPDDDWRKKNKEFKEERLKPLYIKYQLSFTSFTPEKM